MAVSGCFTTFSTAIGLQNKISQYNPPHCRTFHAGKEKTALSIPWAPTGSEMLKRHRW
jgi:hypothetical protein